MIRKKAIVALSLMLAIAMIGTTVMPVYAQDTTTPGQQGKKKKGQKQQQTPPAHQHGQNG
jgi:hypothetical protein